MNLEFLARGMAIAIGVGDDFATPYGFPVEGKTKLAEFLVEDRSLDRHQVASARFEHRRLSRGLQRLELLRDAGGEADLKETTDARRSAPRAAR